MAEANYICPDSNANVTTPISLNERIYRSKPAANIASTTSSTIPSHSVENKDVNDLQVSNNSMIRIIILHFSIAFDELKYFSCMSKLMEYNS